MSTLFPSCLFGTGTYFYKRNVIWLVRASGALVRQDGSAIIDGRQWSFAPIQIFVVLR